MEKAQIIVITTADDIDRLPNTASGLRYLRFLCRYLSEKTPKRLRPTRLIIFFYILSKPFASLGYVETCVRKMTIMPETKMMKFGDLPLRLRF